MVFLFFTPFYFFWVNTTCCGFYPLLIQDIVVEYLKIAVLKNIFLRTIFSCGDYKEQELPCEHGDCIKNLTSRINKRVVIIVNKIPAIVNTIVKLVLL